MAGVEVREVSGDDEADIAGRVVTDAYFDDGFEQESYRPQLLDGRSRAREATLLIAVDAGGEVIGTVTYAVPGQRYAEVSGPDEAEFRMLGVAPAGQRRGVGRALVQACIDRAREQGRGALVLSSEVRMASAHRLYERMGFVRDPERDWQPNPDVSLLAYVLPLRD
jgi:ribosomal protein S18 acetylase RimI-like enzyme